MLMMNDDDGAWTYEERVFVFMSCCSVLRLNIDEQRKRDECFPLEEVEEICGRR